MAYNVTRFGVNAPLQLAPAPEGNTAEDVAARRENLKTLGLDDSFLGKLNDFGGGLVSSRDAFRDQLKSSAMQSLGLGTKSSALNAVGGSTGLAGAAGAAGGGASALGAAAAL